MSISKSIRTQYLKILNLTLPQSSKEQPTLPRCKIKYISLGKKSFILKLKSYLSVSTCTLDLKKDKNGFQKLTLFFTIYDADFPFASP